MSKLFLCISCFLLLYSCTTNKAPSKKQTLYERMSEGVCEKMYNECNDTPEKQEEALNMLIDAYAHIEQTTLYTDREAYLVMLRCIEHCIIDKSRIPDDILENISK